MASLENERDEKKRTAEQLQMKDRSDRKKTGENFKMKINNVGKRKRVSGRKESKIKIKSN